MYKIRRVIITDVFAVCRCYGNQRNQPNHYETLSVENNSSQKDIRDAFLKLSKELHPDIGGKESQAKFVKVNEAYKILSKDHTRRQHDIDLKYQQTAAQNGENYSYSNNVTYHQPENFRSQTGNAQDDNYYGIKGVKRMSNGKVAAICIVVCLFIVSLELAILRRSIIRSQKHLESRSLQAEKDYLEAKAAAESMTTEQQIKALMIKYESQQKQYNLGGGNNR